MERSKKETGKVHLTKQMPSLLINNEEVKGPEKVADAFSSFFLTSAESLNLYQVGKEDAVSFPGKFPDIVITTTKAEIKSIIHSLNQKMASFYVE
jgi:hypothetical protein